MSMAVAAITTAADSGLIVSVTGGLRGTMPEKGEAVFKKHTVCAAFGR